MRGVCTMAATPITARTTNQTTITGPNSRPICAVPRLCITKRPIRMTSVSGMIERLEGAAFDAQAFHGAQHRNRRRQHAVAEEQRQAQDRRDADDGLDPPLEAGERCASAASASTPPSPSLSARMMRTTYLIVTTMMSDQKISDSARHHREARRQRAGRRSDRFGASRRAGWCRYRRTRRRARPASASVMRPEMSATMCPRSGVWRKTTLPPSRGSRRRPDSCAAVRSR